MTKAWRTLAAMSFIGAMALSGCVVGSGDDDDTGGSSGSGGSGGSGGSTGGSGGSTGGTAGSTGGTAGSTGGTAGGGGSAGYVCDNQATGTPTPGTCVPDDPTDNCQTCVQTNCCTQMETCLGTNPNNPCAYGAPDGNGEIYCMITRLQAGDTPGEAAGVCFTPGCGTISDATNDLFTCLDTNCTADCQLSPTN